MGVAYRKYLAESIVGFETDRADLAAFFTRRAADIANTGGKVGLVTTHGVAQGTSMQVSLGYLTAHGWTCYKAVPKRPWSTRSASVYIIQFHISATKWHGEYWLDGNRVTGITAALAPMSRSTWKPQALAENLGMGLQGSKPSGKAFILDDLERSAMLADAPENSAVVRPYLTGSDLYATPEGNARRHIVNFRDWDRERAAEFVRPFRRVERLVELERIGSSEEGNPNWWQFGRPATELYRRIESLDRVIVFAETSKTLTPVMVSVGPTFSNTVVVLPFADYGTFAVLASAPHYWWALSNGTSMKKDPRYQVPRCFENYPRPVIDGLQGVGMQFSEIRSDIARRRGVGLTELYNLFHDECCGDSDIEELRAIQRKVDAEVLRAYGWKNLLDQSGGLDHGFHPTEQGPRYTVGPVVRQEILDRLLEENQRRYAAEVAVGLHDKKGAKKKATAARASRRPKPPAEEPPSLF